MWNSLLTNDKPLPSRLFVSHTDLTNAIKDPNDTSGAVSTTAQLAAVAAATAVALVW
jgi:hypothetical protein